MSLFPDLVEQGLEFFHTFRLLAREVGSLIDVFGKVVEFHRGFVVRRVIVFRFPLLVAAAHVAVLVSDQQPIAVSNCL